jgi:hypothetical protein
MFAMFCLAGIPKTNFAIKGKGNIKIDTKTEFR